MSPVTSHVLDTALGTPARGLEVVLDRHVGGEWRTLSKRSTNADGRVGDLLDKGELEPGLYRLTFSTGAYFEATARRTFYPEVIVVFRIEDAGQHYHVPLLLSPFGYSTYRGS